MRVEEMPFLERAARVLAAATLAAAVAGFVVGGLGGRLVMRILAQTSDAALKGVDTENGNNIREFTLGGTLGLVAFLTLFSAAGGAAYIALRRWMPSNHRALTFGVMAIGFPGAVIIDPNNKDFRILDPKLLSVLLFVALMFGFGWLLATVHERIEPLWLRARLRGPGVLVFAPFLVLVPVFPFFVLIFLLTIVCWGFSQIGATRRLWDDEGMDFSGRILLAIGTTAFLGLALKHSLEILT